MPEAAHEAGRKGSLRAQHLLWQILADNISLPFNAYDHEAKLTFADASAGGPGFSFDLRGQLKRPNAKRFGGNETVEVFVEMKAHATGDGLLVEYRKFLRRAAIVTTLPEHRDTWFIYLASAPFGTSIGVALCDGSLLKECSADWPGTISKSADGLHERITLLIATPSFERLLNTWGRDV